MRNFTRRSQLFFSILISVLLISFIVISISPSFSISNNLYLTVLGFITSFFLIYLFFFPNVLPKLIQNRKGNIIGLICLFLSAIILILLPIRLSNLQKNSMLQKLQIVDPIRSIEVENYEISNPNSSEVRLTGIIIDELLYSMGNVTALNGWSLEEQQMVSYSTGGDSLIIELPENSSFSLRFETSPNGGVVKISHGDAEIFYDLQSEKPYFYFTPDLSLFYENFNINTSSTKKVLFYTTELCFLWMITSSITVCLLLKKQNKPSILQKELEKSE